MNEFLKEAILAETAKCSLKSLSEAREELTKRYRERDEQTRFMTSEAHRQAYLLSRMPATFSVVKRVLSEIQETSFQNALDLGCGPGTVLWAIADLFPDMQHVTLLEQDPQLIAMGKRLAKDLSISTTWQQGDMLSALEFPAHDLITMSYSIGELPLERVPQFVQKLWQAAKKMLVIIEPGTKHGFQRIRLVRDELLRLGAFSVAPCPHGKPCPMSSDDWCHFSERVERSSQHRQIKGASLGHEDEKYSYFIASKTEVPLPKARILRHPDKHSGHIQLNVCGTEGIEKKIISRRDGDLYKKARKVDWGDVFPI